MTDAYLKTTAQKAGETFALIHEFNLEPARYLHYSWAETMMQGTLYEYLIKSRRGERIVSRQILKNHNLENAFYFDFSHNLKRLALVDSKTIQTLFFLVGVGLCHMHIRHMIQKDALDSLKKTIGEDAYRFATRTAPLLVGNQQFDFLPQSELMPDKESFSLLGAKCFSAFYSGEAPALIQRIRLKLPRHLNLNFDIQVSRIVKDKIGKLLKKILLQEVNPAWAPLFL